MYLLFIDFSLLLEIIDLRLILIGIEHLETFKAVGEITTHAKIVLCIMFSMSN